MDNKNPKVITIGQLSEFRKKHIGYRDEIMPIIVRITDDLAFPIQIHGVDSFSDMNSSRINTRGFNFVMVCELPDDTREAIAKIFDADKKLKSKKDISIVRAEMVSALLNDLENRDETICDLKEENEELRDEVERLGKKLKLVTQMTDEGIEKFNKLLIRNRILKGGNLCLERDINNLKLDLEAYHTVIKCTVCGRPMKLRNNGVTGGKFWGCSGYPDFCHHTRNLDASI